MEPAVALPEQEVGVHAPMTDAKINAIGTVLAAVARLLKYQRHWLSVAQFIIIASRALAILIVELIRLARERAIALTGVVAVPFAVMHRHLSRPPSRWASA